MAMETAQIEDTPHQTIIILILGFLAAFGPLSIDMYLPAFPHVAQTLGVPLSQVQLSLSSYFVGLASGQLFYGPLTDRIGRKWPLYIGLTLYGVSSLICSVAPNIEVLILARFLQALGACAGIVVSRAIVRDLYHHQQAARVFSLLMLIMGIAPILAPIIGGYLDNHYGWRMIFSLLTAISFVCLLAIFKFLPETHKPNIEVRTERLLKVYLGIFKDRQFTINAITGGFVQAGLFAYITGSPFIFMEYYKIPADQFAWFFGSNAFGLIFFSQVNGKLLRKFTIHQILKTVLPFIASLSLVLIISGILGAGLWSVVVPLFLIIASMGMTFPNTTAAALSNQGKNAGSASALLGALQFTLSACSSALVSLLADGTLIPMTIVMGFFGVGSFILYRFNKA
jgi:DHA1 family bicyclomycin/chloramphenicol resistance-like MFS transporter